MPSRRAPSVSTRSRASANVSTGSGTVTKSAPGSLPPLKLTYGSDPELMIVDVKAGGKIVSALRILDKTKEDPIDLGGGIKMYADSTLVETAFPPVSAQSGQIVNHLRGVFARMQKQLGDRYQLLPKAAHVFDPDELKDERAWTVGCHPFLDCWKREFVHPKEFGDGLRSGSAHLHVGREDWENPPAGDDRLLSQQSKEEAVRVMDTIVGCASVVICRDHTAADRRRLMYGKAGSARFTPYGFEWRPMESYPLSTPELAQLVWDLTDHAMSHISFGTSADLLKTVNTDDVQRAINSSDKDLARKVLARATLPHKLAERVEKDYQVVPFAQAWELNKAAVAA